MPSSPTPASVPGDSLHQWLCLSRRLLPGCVGVPETYSHHSSIWGQRRASIIDLAFLVFPVVTRPLILRMTHHPKSEVAVCPTWDPHPWTSGSRFLFQTVTVQLIPQSNFGVPPHNDRYECNMYIWIWHHQSAVTLFLKIIVWLIIVLHCILYFIVSGV